MHGFQFIAVTGHGVPVEMPVAIRNAIFPRCTIKIHSNVPIRNTLAIGNTIPIPIRISL